MKLAEYVLEEIAMFISLYKQGYHIEVYSGADMPIMKGIVAGKYRGILHECPLRTHVSIQTKEPREETT